MLYRFVDFIHGVRLYIFVYIYIIVMTSKRVMHGIILELQTTSLKWMFVETSIFHVKILNHSIKTTIYK